MEALPSTVDVTFSPLVLLLIVRLKPMMGTPSRVKGGIQEMRIVVELIVITDKLLTDPK